MSTRNSDFAVACIVLAAGSGSRFGSDKRFALLPNGTSLMAGTMASIPDLFSQYLLVLQPEDRNLAAAFHGHWTAVFAQDANLGMGHSLAAGLRAVTAAAGALVVLADMPQVSAATFLALARTLTPDSIVVPRHQGKRGNPVGIGRNFFGELLNPQGDQGARMLLQKFPEAVHWVDCDDAGILRDVDVPADLQG